MARANVAKRFLGAIAAIGIAAAVHASPSVELIAPRAGSVLQGGSDEEIQDWCFEHGRRLNEADLLVWNGFAMKLGWNDFAAPNLQRRKEEMGIANRDDIATISDLIDFDEGRIK